MATAPLTAPAWLEEVGQRSEILRLTAKLLGILERSLWSPVKKLKIQVQEAR